eukprot:6172338-Pleurochrysis_carterae.AAC.3
MAFISLSYSNTPMRNFCATGGKQRAHLDTCAETFGACILRVLGGHGSSASPPRAPQKTSRSCKHLSPVEISLPSPILNKMARRVC